MRKIEIKKTYLELSVEEDEILKKAAKILDELHFNDDDDLLFDSVLEENCGCMNDFSDIANILKTLAYQENAFEI